MERVSKDCGSVREERTTIEIWECRGGNPTGNVVIEECSEPSIQVRHVGTSLTVNKSNVRENTDDTLSLRFEYLCQLACSDEGGDFAQILFVFVIEERDGLVGKIPVETAIEKGIRKFLAFALVPRDTKWSYHGFDGCEVITIWMIDTITGTEKCAIRLGKAEDIEIVDPLNCWGDFMMLLDVDSSIGYFALEARGRCEAERDIMIHVEQTIKVNDKELFVIRFHGDCAICTVNVQHSCKGNLTINTRQCNTCKGNPKLIEGTLDNTILPTLQGKSEENTLRITLQGEST
jgi:hypothetical protein